MKLIVGLGNPGAKYAQNRHNIGFMAVDRMVDDHNGSAWSKKFQGQLATVQFGSTKATLLKPDTFMNRSGQSVAAAVQFFKLGVEDVVVLHDELDLAPGKCKVKHGGGHAGHNGLRDIHAHLGPDYTRVRLGIGHPGHKDKVPGYVLRDFAKAEQDWLDTLMRGISNGAKDLAKGDWGRFMNAVSLQTNPPRSSNRPKQQKADLPKPAPKVESAQDTRSPLERLMSKFK
ncbi:MAG: aminoacyl-tRNA hydrolase [Planktomarina sp.]